MPRECLRIIESKSKVHNSRNKAVVAKVSSNSSTPGISPDVVALTTKVSELKNLMKTMLIDKQKAQAPATVNSLSSSSSTNASSNTASSSNSGPSTPLVPTPVIPTPLKEPEQNPETSMDKVQKPSSKNTAQVPPPEDHDSIFIEILKPKAKKTVQEPISPDPNSYQPKLPYPERMKVRERERYTQCSAEQVYEVV
ncbi:hypothetical protein Tco_1286358 [Tanacetum coccineum]